MIVITSRKDIDYSLMTGDCICVVYEGPGSRQTDYREEITKPVKYDILLVFRFCLEDGTVVGDNLSIFLGRKDEMPTELLNAVYYEDLTTDQKLNLVTSIPAVEVT